MQITAKKIRPYVQTFFYAAILATCLGIFLFLKTYLYPAITGSQTILELQKSMTTETIDLNKFDELIKNINKKTSPLPSQEKINDPFK